MDREEQYDLLTAALLGVAVGAAAAMLVSVSLPRRQVHPLRKAARQGGQLARRSGRAAMAAPEVVREQLGEYLSSAREAITDTVEAELKDLRRSIRRRRRRLGL